MNVRPEDVPQRVVEAAMLAYERCAIANPMADVSVGYRAAIAAALGDVILDVPGYQYSPALR